MALAALARAFVTSRVVHFLAIGAVLAALAPKEEDRPAVVVDAARVERAAGREEKRIGRALTPEESERVRLELVDESVLAREAARLGVGLDDDVVRARLAERMRAAYESGLPEPRLDPGELAEEKERLARAAPERVRVAVWFVAKDRPEAARAAEALQREIAALGHERARGRGDPTPVPDGATWTEEALGRVAGPSVARAAMTGAIGAPTPPLASAWGFYVLVPLERRPALPSEVEAEAVASLRRKKLAADVSVLVARLRKDAR